MNQIKKSLVEDNNSNEYSNVIIRCKESLILDGEIVVLNEEGIPDFQMHQRRMNVESASKIAALETGMAATYYVFDILYLDGRNLQGLPLIDRREVLSEAISIADGANASSPSSANYIIRISQYVEKHGRQLFEQSKLLNLEGVVAK